MKQQYTLIITMLTLFLQNCGTVDCIEYTSGRFPENLQQNIPLTTIFGPFRDPILKGQDGEVTLVEMSDPPLTRMFTNETPLEHDSDYSIYFSSTIRRFHTATNSEIMSFYPQTVTNASIKSKKLLTVPNILSNNTKYQCEDHLNAEITFDCPENRVAGIFHCKETYCSPLYPIENTDGHCSAIIGAETFNGDSLNLQFLTDSGIAGEAVATIIKYYY